MRPFSFDQAFDRHSEIGPGLVSVRDLSEHFDTGDSVAALLRRMGPFVATTDAFRFENDFAINAEQTGDFLDTLTDAVVEGVVEQVVGIYANVLRGIDINPLPLVENRIPDAVIDFVNGSVSAELTARIIDSAADPAGSNYGRCGGMAFAGYDFYLAGRPIDATVTDPPAEGPLGDYIYERLLDSLRLNVGTFVEWVVRLHYAAALGEIATTALGAAVGNVVGGPIGGAILAIIGNQADIFDLAPGPEALLDWTKDEWTRLKDILDHQAAWPIGLVYGDKPLFWDQHQVLAIGCTDNGAGQGTLRIWDNEDGNQPATMRLDFRGDELQVTGSDPTVKGFFHERYMPQRPPQGL
jgi:hypothetical protein